MELKYCEKLPMTDKHGLRTSQKLWIKRRQREHGTGPIVLAIGTRTQYHKLGSIVFFVDGAHAQTINSWTLEDFFKSSTPFAQLSDVRTIENAFRFAVTHFCR